MPTSKSEGSPDLPQRNPRWERVGVVAASLAAWTAGGAYLGYEGGTRLEKSGNIAYAEQATRYERCLTLVKKNLKPGQETAVVHLSSMSSQEQDDCGFGGLNLGLQYEAEDMYLPYALDGEIIRLNADPEVQLPSTGKLERAISKNKNEADDIGNTLPIGVAVLGGTLAFISYLFAVGGTISLYYRRKER